MKIQENGHEYIVVDCIQVTQPVGSFYVASIGHKDLLNFSYADRRRLETNSTEIEEYIGIQRLLKRSRIKEIQNYIKNVDATFPTGIILEIDQFAKQKNENDDEEIVTFDAVDGEKKPLPNVSYDADGRKLKIRNNENVAKILDGQHRLEGLKESDLENEKFQLNVVIFVDLALEDQAIVFATINKAQTKVDNSLVADLFEYTRTRSPQKTAHNITRALDRKEDSPFHKKIRILGVAEEKSETITQATFVGSLLKYISGNSLRAMRDRDAYKRGTLPDKVFGKEAQRLFLRNMFIDEEDAKIAQILRNYFNAVKHRWPRAWAAEVNLILNKSTGFVALMKFLKDAYFHVGKPGSVPSEEEFHNIFARITLTDDDFNKQKYVPGGIGQATLYKDLHSQGIPTHE